LEDNKYATANDIASELDISRKTAFGILKEIGVKFSLPT